MERKRVLILDDSPVVLAAAARALEAAGLQALCAVDLAELEQRLDQHPDLVVIDVNIPEIYGDDVAAVLRGARGLAVPILLFSSIPEAELAARAAEAGADGYVVKGQGMAGLVERVRALLA